MEYSPIDPKITQNPYPTYAFLRREAPIYRTAQGLLAVSRYEDVLAILRDPVRFSSSAMGDLVGQVTSVALDDDHQGGETLIGTDPPRHSRLRKIVNRAFTPQRVAALEPRIHESDHENLHLGELEELFPGFFACHQHVWEDVGRLLECFHALDEPFRFVLDDSAPIHRGRG